MYIADVFELYNLCVHYGLLSEINLSYLILLYTSGFGYIWEQQTVTNKEKFLHSLEARCKDMYMQQCLSNINASSRCRLYRNLKEDFKLAPYLRKNNYKDLPQCLTKIRLSSHKFFIERGRWLKPKVEYCDRLCTLCEKETLKTNII